jgi:hypothetical protein
VLSHASQPSKKLWYTPVPEHRLHSTTPLPGRTGVSSVSPTLYSCHFKIRLHFSQRRGVSSGHAPSSVSHA